ncbi:MAG: cytochrome c3 family protein [Thermoanaerobaculia bacterium]
MKKLTVLVVLAVAFAFAVSAPAVITGSKHDFSSAANNTWNPKGQICQPCHTPHNAGTLTNVPLWNHASTTATFTVYDSPTLNATGLGQPAGVSKACLSCHDGTVALDSFGGATGTHNITGNALLGTTLSNDHPVSFLYDTTLATADGGLKDPATTAAVSALLFAGQMECGSCHDVHDTPGVAKLLVKSNAGSALCLTCHDK